MRALLWFGGVAGAGVVALAALPPWCELIVLPVATVAYGLLFAGDGNRESRLRKAEARREAEAADRRRLEWGRWHLNGCDCDSCPPRGWDHV
jgi:hypothetical protein